MLQSLIYMCSLLFGLFPYYLLNNIMLVIDTKTVNGFDKPFDAFIMKCPADALKYQNRQKCVINFVKIIITRYMYYLQSENELLMNTTNGIRMTNIPNITQSFD